MSKSSKELRGRRGRRVRARYAAKPQAAVIEAFEERVLLTAGSYTAAYFNNADLTSPVLNRPDALISFDWGQGPPADGVGASTFSVRWTGTIVPAFSQTYTFFATADDGVRLKVNGQTLVDRWTTRTRLAGDANGDGIVNFVDFQMLEIQFGTKGPQCDFNDDGTVNAADFKILNDNLGKTLAVTSTTSTGSIALQAGHQYTLSMEYFNDSWQANAKLEWQSSGQARQLVPASTFDPAAPVGDSGGDGTITPIGGGAVVVGTGNGLLGTYYDGPNFTGSRVSRVDPAVAFHWTGIRPLSRIDATTFSVRWEGQVEAPVTGTYTFYSNADDGTRLWIDGQKVLDYWVDTSESENPSFPVQMVAGQKYDIRFEYYQNQGDAVAELRWDGPIAKQIVPTSQLYPALVPSGGSDVPAGATGALRVSADGHFIEQTDGTPFFWLADTAWSLLNNSTRADVDYYLQDRAAKEFTVTQTVLYNPDAYDTNLFNQPVFLNNNPATPNASYFTHVDYALQKADGAGLYVALLPTWGDAVGASDSRRVFTVANAYAYGLWLGQRYAQQSNIIWDLGGDWPAGTADVQAVWRSMASGLAAGDGGSHLITYHPSGGHSSSEYFAGDQWLAFNTVQSGHTRDSANYNLIAADYGKGKPVIDGEPNYENIPNGLSPTGDRLDDYDVRKKTYWSLFAGAFGAAYGNLEVYEFADGSEPGTLPWRDALNYPGADEMRFARHLMQSRPYTGRVPDQSIIVAGQSSGTNHVQATRGGDGSDAMVYLASGQPVTVNMAKITGGGQVTAWWYNPRDGSVERIGNYDNTGTQTFSPESSGQGNDWVLVLDDASKGYPEPGDSTSAATPPTTGDLITGTVSDDVASIPYRLYTPSGVPAGERVPLVLYLHGVGESGTDNVKQTTWMGGLINATKGGQYASYVLAPQIDTSMWFQSYNASPTEAMKLVIKVVKDVIATQSIDPTRVYVTGVSMGGMGTWDILRWEPTLFAAAVPMSGGADPSTAAAIKDIPVWAFHGSADPIVPVSATRNIIAALQAAGGTPKYTEVAGGGHVIWNPIYGDASNTLYPWLFSQHRAAGGGAAASPVVKTPVTTGGTGKPTPVKTVVKPVRKPAVAIPVFSVKPVTVEKAKKPAAKNADSVFNIVPAKAKPATTAKPAIRK